MELMASEIYKKALKLAESEAHQKTLCEMMNEELSHVKLVKEMLELVES